MAHKSIIVVVTAFDLLSVGWLFGPAASNPTLPRRDRGTLITGQERVSFPHPGRHLEDSDPCDSHRPS